REPLNYTVKPRECALPIPIRPAYARPYLVYANLAQQVQHAFETRLLLPVDPLAHADAVWRPPCQPRGGRFGPPIGGEDAHAEVAVVRAALAVPVAGDGLPPFGQIHECVPEHLLGTPR